MLRLVCLSSLATALLCGCAGRAESTPAQVKVEHAELGRQFLLAEEPAGAVSILDYREAQAAIATQTNNAAPPMETEPAKDEVALLGRIGGSKAVWSSQSASFWVSDPAHELTAASQHVCDSDNCPFCKAKQGADLSHAIVMLTGAEGRVPPHDARKLLPLEEGQLVVVRGRPEINALGQLVIYARGLYVRR